MAELALLASIVQIAETGYRLSLKLYTTGEAISSADRAIVTISKDISLTSTVLEELGQILGRDEDENERICSENLIQTAGDTVKECLEGNKATRATMAMERLKWPFIQPRIQLLKGSLDMLRANISLMLNVLIYARHKSERKKLRAPSPTYDEASQKTIIEELHNAKEEYVRKFESLKLSIPASPSTQQVHNIGSRAAPAHTEGNVVPTEHTLNPVSATTSQNAPAPQHTFNPLSTTTSQNAPAPQWPLPNIIASYPIASKDPVTIQSGQYNLRELLDHFDALLKNLVREVYLPGYHIPAESRSRFTDAIRKPHFIEAIEAQIRNSSKSGDFEQLQRSIASPVEATHLSLAHPEPVSTLSPTEPTRPKPLRFDLVLARNRRMQDPDLRREQGREEEQPATKKCKSYAGEVIDSEEVSDISPPFAPEAAILSPGFTLDLELPQQGPEPQKTDVVDDLVKLWTLVR